MSAYDECYLDSMFQKTRYLFKLIARNCDDVFGVISNYMNSEYRKRMDAGVWIADIYTYMQWKYEIASSDIVQEIQPKELYEKDYPLHETSVENGTEKLKKLYGI